MSAVPASAVPTRRPLPGLRTVRLFLSRPAAIVAVCVLGLIILAAILSPWIAPYDWDDAGAVDRLGPPSADAWFGGDLHGRDIFSRVIAGGRYSITIGLATVALSLISGGLIGIVLGYAGGRIDAVGSRAIDVLLGIPSIVMAVLVVSVLGVGLVNATIAVAISHIPRYARVVRGSTLALRQQPFIEALDALGASHTRILFRHLLPNVAPILVVIGTLNLGDAILSTSTLSFLGLGAQPPTPEWGTMLSEGRDYMRYAPWMMIFPGLALFLTVMSVNFLGDRLNQVLDPRALGRR